jgi:hypothetical protein
VDGRRAARAVLVWDVEDGQPVAFEGPAATTDWCVRVSMCARAGAGATAPCYSALCCGIGVRRTAM